MTEQEVIKEFEERLAIADYRDNIPKYYKAMELAIKDMKEIQKYRAIGTPDKIKEELDHLRNDNDCQGLYFTLEERQDLARQHRELEKYRAIGTLEECRGEVKKQKAKKPIRNDKCTCHSCGTHNEVFKKRRNTVAHDIVYCWHCGQAVEIDRLDGEENE